MTERLYVGTRKGLFELVPGRGGWDIAEVSFLGDPVTAILARDGTVHAALDLGHFGGKLWRRDGNEAWRELAAPAFPPKPEAVADDPHPWSLGKIWVIEPGHVPGRLWAGTMPGGLFRSDDAGETWSLNEPLWRMPERRQWQGVAGGEQPGISSVLIDPRNPDAMRVGVSTAGVWESTDRGASWRIINQGMYNEYMPPGREGEPIAQDIHRLAQCPAQPSVVWCQHHNGVFRSDDAGHNWRELTRSGRRNSASPSPPIRATQTRPGSCRRSRTRSASRSRARSRSPAPATAAKASRYCGTACRSATPTTSSGGTRWQSMPPASASPSARPAAACGFPKTPARAGLRPTCVCRRYRSCASPRRECFELKPSLRSAR